MQSKSWNVLLGFAVIAALFSLYSVIYFWTIQDIADPNSIARIRRPEVLAYRFCRFDYTYNFNLILLPKDPKIAATQYRFQLCRVRYR